MEEGKPIWRPERLFPHRGAFILGNPIYRRLMRIDPNPTKIADWVGVKKGMDILELGPGPGYYTLTLARRVDNGTIYAVDIQAEMLAKLEKKIKKANITNVRIYVADAEKIPLPNNSVDLVWALYVLEEVQDLEMVAKEIYRVLRAGGLLVIAQFALDFTKQQKAAMKKIIPEVGFELIEEIDTWWNYKAKYKKPPAEN